MSYNPPLISNTGEYFGNMIGPESHITLLDLFAGAALIGLLSNGTKLPTEKTASLAYDVAYQMLEERNKGGL